MHQLLHLFSNSKAFKYTLLAVSVSLLFTTQASATGFQIQLETDVDIVNGAGAEVFYIGYDSFADLLTETASSAGFSQLGPAPNFTTSGLAFEGNKGVIPEPSTILLFGTGLTGLVAWRMRKGRA